MATSAEIRQHLADALGLDLIGPDWSDTARRHEHLPQPPSVWYTTGFLVPHVFEQEAGRTTEAEQLSFADLAGEEPSNGASNRLEKQEKDDDANDALDQANTRRSWFPSSLGLSFILEKGSTLEATVTWGDYSAPADGAKEKTWSRTPQRQNVKISIDRPDTSPEIPLAGQPQGLCLRWIARPAPSKLGYPRPNRCAIAIRSRRSRLRAASRAACSGEGMSTLDLVGPTPGVLDQLELEGRTEEATELREEVLDRPPNSNASGDDTGASEAGPARPGSANPTPRSSACRPNRWRPVADLLRRRRCPAAPEATAMASIGPLQQQRRFAEARPLLETLLQLEHEHPEALYNLGVLAREEGQPEDAQANAQVALALAAMRLGDMGEGRQALEAAIELEPQNSFALSSLGSLLVIAGAFAAGVARFRSRS